MNNAYKVPEEDRERYSGIICSYLDSRGRETLSFRSNSKDKVASLADNNPNSYYNLAAEACRYMKQELIVNIRSGGMSNLVDVLQRWDQDEAYAEKKAKGLEAKL